MTFRAKKDLWLACMLASFVVTFTGGGVFFIVMAAGDPAEIAGGVVALAVGLFFLWGFLGTSYEITPSHVVVRAGALHWRIPVDAIVAVTPTDQRRLLLGGTHLRLACSADALMIRYRKKSGKKWFGLVEPEVLISPQDKAGFVRTLAQALPNMECSDDGGLRRRTETTV